MMIKKVGLAKKWLLLLASIMAVAVPAAEVQAANPGLAVIAQVAIGWVWGGVAVNPLTNRVYVGTTGATQGLWVIDGTTNSVVATLATDTVYGVAVNPTTNRAYLAELNSVLVLDGATNTILKSIGVAGRLTSLKNPIALNPVTNRIYVALLLEDTVVVINGDTDSVIANLSTGVPSGVAVNPATNRIYVANKFARTVTVIDGTNDRFEAMATVAVPGAPIAIAANAVTNRIYVSSVLSTTWPNEFGISVIDGDSNTVITSFFVGGDDPFNLEVNAETNRIYSGRGHIIDGNTNTLLGYLVGFPFTPGWAGPFIGVNPSTKRVYLGFESFLSVLAETPGFRVTNPPPGLYMKSTSRLNLLQTSFALDQDAFVVTREGLILARLALKFSQVTADMDFSNLVAQIDYYYYRKAVLHFEGPRPSGVGRVDLYVPKQQEHDRVRVVPGAKTLDEVYSGAPGSYVLKLGETKNGTTLAIKTLEGQDYWVVKGITGTGAIAEEPPAPTPTPAPTAIPPPARGRGIASVPDPSTWALIVSGLALFGLYAILCRRRRAT